MLKCEQIATVDKHEVLSGPLGGPLSAALIAGVQRAILRAIGVPVPEC